MTKAFTFIDSNARRLAYAGDLAKGLWPGSLLMWMITGWFALYIIRPWEVLFPSLAPWHVERIYCVSVLAFIGISGRLRADLSRQSWTFGLLLLAMTLSAFGGIAYYASQDAIYGLLVHGAMYVVMISVVRKPRDLLCIAASYIAIMAAYLGKAQWEYFVHGRHDFSQGVPRLIGIDNTYRHYNSVAASAILTLPFLHLLWTMRGDLSHTYSKPARRRMAIYLVGYGALALTSVLLTNSRGGILGLAIFFLISCFTGRTLFRALKVLALSGPILIMTWLLAVPETQQQRLRTLWSDSGNASAHGSVELRKQAALDGLKMFFENPVSGVGIGNFKRYRVLRGDASNLEAHNVFVHILGESGLVGGIAFCLFVGCMWSNFRQTRKLASEHPGPETDFLKKLALAGRNSLLLLMYFGLLGSNLDRFNWFWLAGIGVAGVQMARKAALRAFDESDWQISETTPSEWGFEVEHAPPT